MAVQKYISVRELAELLGVSRIAVYKRVKKGQIPATKIGKTYVITDQTVMQVLGKAPTDRGKREIEIAVRKTVQDYGDVLAKLSRE